MKTNTKLNTKLKELRTRHRWTQQDVAYMVGMSAADVSRLENLRIKAYPSQTHRIAALFTVDVKDLFREDGEAR